MSADLDVLEQLARAATAGPWRVDEFAIESDRYRVLADDEMSVADADFIAAANPVVIVELAQRVRAAEDAVCKATTMSIRDMNTVSEYNALYHRANDRTRQLAAIVHDLAAEHDNWVAGHVKDVYGIILRAVEATER